MLPVGEGVAEVGAAEVGLMLVLGVAGGLVEEAGVDPPPLQLKTGGPGMV